MVDLIEVTLEGELVFRPDAFQTLNELPATSDVGVSGAKLVRMKRMLLFTHRYLSAWSNHHCPILRNSALNQPETTLTEIRLIHLVPSHYQKMVQLKPNLPIGILVNARNLFGCYRWIPGAWKQCCNNVELGGEVK